MLIDQYNPLAALRRRQRRRKPSRTSANDQDLAMGKAVQIGVGIGLGWRMAKPGGGADIGLIELIPGLTRPHKGLVVKARWNEWRDEIQNRPNIKAQAWPAVLALCDKTVIELDLGCPQIRRNTRLIAAHSNQGIGLFSACAQNAARAMVFERTAHKPNAIGQKGRGQGIAL